MVVSAGSVGTAELLLRCRARGSLPALSPMLGGYLRTNSEALLAVRARGDEIDHSKGIAITSGAYLDERTHVEIVRYPSGSDAMAFLSTVLTDDGTGCATSAALAGERAAPAARFSPQLEPGRLRPARRHPPRHAADRQPPALRPPPGAGSGPSVCRSTARRRWRFSAEQAKVPVYLPLANEAARRLAVKMDGDGAQRHPRGAHRPRHHRPRLRRLPHRSRRRGRGRRPVRTRLRV